MADLTASQQGWRTRVRWRGRYGWLLVFVLVGCLLAEGLFRSGLLVAFDRRIQDVWFQWQGQRAPASHVVIVSIDEASLSRYPDDPLVFWTDKFALAIERLRQAQVRMVGLDMLLSISPERWLGQQGVTMQAAAREYDRAFRDQIHSGQLVLVASKPGAGAAASDFLLPSPDYLLAVPDFDLPRFVGIADFPQASDGVVREFQLAVRPPSDPSAAAAGLPFMGFPALLTLHAAGLDPLAPGWTLQGRALSRDQGLQPIPFVGPPGSIPTLSFQTLLSQAGLPAPIQALLRDKVVLLGAGVGLGDAHLTPYATSFLLGRGRLMDGVEVHANVVEALLSGQRLLPMGAVARGAILLMLTAVSVMVFVRVSLWQAGLFWLLLLALLVASGYLLFRSGVVMSVTAPAVACASVLLGVAAWRLSSEERERERLRQMFGRYVSPQVVAALLHAGVRPDLGGRVQTVTVLFADIRNFTLISELLSAREVVEMLNAYFGRACEIMQREGGSIDKFIGDAIMVEFGSPWPVPDHALRGVRAALALHALVQEFGVWMRTRFPDRGLPEFDVGIGLHSGDAVVGNIGSPTRMEFTAIGDTVNLASRVEGMTKQLGCAILVTQDTRAQLGDQLLTGRSDLVQVKGRTAGVRVFEVTGLKSGAITCSSG